MSGSLSYKTAVYLCDAYEFINNEFRGNYPDTIYGKHRALHEWRWIRCPKKRLKLENPKKRLVVNQWIFENLFIRKWNKINVNFMINKCKSGEGLK